MTGDYAIKKYCEYDEVADTYYPQCAVERKGRGDFLNSITWERDRFRNEIRRADGWTYPLIVIVESPRQVFQDESHYRQVTAKQVFGTVDAWAGRYNVDFYFRRDR